MSSSKTSSISTLKIIVGPERKEFAVKKALICSESKFFNSACSNSASEFSGIKISRETSAISLPKFNLKIFNIFITWILTKSLSTAYDLNKTPLESFSDTESDFRARHEAISTKYNQFCDCLIDSCTLGCEGFEEAINEATIQFCKDVFAHFALPEGTPVDIIARICKANKNAALMILEPQISVERAEKWMYDHDGYMMLHNNQRQFYDELIITSMMIRLGRAKSGEGKGGAKGEAKEQGKGKGKAVA